MNSCPAALAVEDLLLHLRPLNRALRAAVERQRRASQRLAQPGLKALCITDEQAAALLEQVSSYEFQVSGFESRTLDLKPETRNFLPEEEEAHAELRALAERAGALLPLDLLAESVGLDAFELSAVVACAAPEVERAYERVYAYALDDLNRQRPCVELLCLLASEETRERLALRRSLSRFGRLRRSGLLLPAGDPAPTDLRQELRLAPGLFDFLTGAPLDPASFAYDPAEVSVPADAAPPSSVAPETVRRLAASLAREGEVSAVGVWGPRHSGKEEFVRALAAACRAPLRVLRASDLKGADAEVERAARESVQTAAALGALLWVEADELAEPEHARAADVLAETLARSPRVAALITSARPWRHERLLAARTFAEFELTAPDFGARREMWARELPEGSGAEHEGLAARFRLGAAEVRAASRLARARAAAGSNGHARTPFEEIDAACAAVTLRRSDGFATAVRPRRTPEDLVLPRDVHNQVVELARFFRAAAVVDEQWGFGRMATGGGGIKALFTGDPGTGKTLAAEVIAGLLGLPLLKVDLARVVSKWVGETEKNLDTVFREAEESNSVLFFDEADSLFGKRGEVQRGTDRYANLEVGFLLQRLEDYFGLVILASNLRDQIDAAFTRRFHAIIHFPAPRPEERRRIWERAFPATSPLGGDVDFDFLQGLDMNGAGIVSAARTAAMLAADEPCANIRMKHLVRAVARQYRREARIFSPASMGPYASLLGDAR